MLWLGTKDGSQAPDDGTVWDGRPNPNPKFPNPNPNPNPHPNPNPDPDPNWRIWVPPPVVQVTTQNHPLYQLAYDDTYNEARC